MSTLRRLLSGFVVLTGFAPAAAYAEFVSNPVTGYQVSLFRDGGSQDFQGWIRLFNGDKDAGYLYVHNGTQMLPRLGSTKYVVLDVTVPMLDATLSMLDSGLPIFITYNDFGDPANASGFLHVGGDALPAIGEAEEIARAFRIEPQALTEEP